MFQVDEQTCIGCGQCVDECRVGAITLVQTLAHIDPALCIECRTCVETCPVQAIIDQPAENAVPAPLPRTPYSAPPNPPESTARPRAGLFAQIMQTAGKVFGGGMRRSGVGRGRRQSQNGQHRGKGKFRGGR